MILSVGEQGRRAKMLRRRRDAEAQASGKTEGGEEKDAGIWVSIDPAGGVHCGAADGGGVAEHKAEGAERHPTCVEEPTTTRPARERTA